MTADKRTVATDALDTLGTHPIPDNSGRDAIHLAVEPVEAAETLIAGQDIGFVDGKASCKAPHKVGIVDPFLKEPVRAGQRFWLVVYPREITSLRHVWTHPSFEDEERDEDSTLSELRLKESSEQWLRNYATSIDENFNTLMEAADAFVNDEEYYYGSRTGGYYGKFEGERTDPGFWSHYENYRGKTVPEDRKRSFFTCSC